MCSFMLSDFPNGDNDRRKRVRTLSRKAREALMQQEEPRRRLRPLAPAITSEEVPRIDVLAIADADHPISGSGEWLIRGREVALPRRNRRGLYQLSDKVGARIFLLFVCSDIACRVT